MGLPKRLPLRRALAALCLVLLLDGIAVAQDPKASAAQATARDWLVLIDRGDAQASWSGASQRFRDAMTLSAWTDALKKSRVPLGTVLDRATVKTSFQKSFTGVPEGDYALVSFATRFANRLQGHETVTLEREADGNWRVLGYFVR
jgi:hypothetical protein